MKKILVTGLVAISMLAIAQQQASAWVNSKFGIGLNWDLQSGGNQILWGAWRNGQPPGPEAFSGGPYQPTYRGPAGAPAFGSAPMPQGFSPMQQGSFDAQSFEPPYANAYQAPSAAPYQAPFAGGYQTPFQFANYPRPSNTYYYTPAPTYYYYGR